MPRKQPHEHVAGPLPDTRHEAYARLRATQPWSMAKCYREAFGHADEHRINSNTTYKLEQRADVQLRIAEFLKELQRLALEDRRVGRQYLVDGSQEVFERCMNRVPVVDGRGEQVKDDAGNDVWKFDANGAIRALDHIAKVEGHYATEKQRDEMGEKSESELFDRFKALERELAAQGVTVGTGRDSGGAAETQAQPVPPLPEAG